MDFRNLYSEEEIKEFEDELNDLESKIKELNQRKDNLEKIIEILRNKNEDESEYSQVISLIPVEKIADITWKTRLAKESVSEEDMAAAYKWASDFRKNNNMKAQPIRLLFNQGDVIRDDDGFSVSFFYDSESGNALVRRDWENELAIQFNIITNYEDIRKTAPNSLIKMLKNGINLYYKWINGD